MTDGWTAPAEWSASSSNRLHEELLYVGSLQLTERSVRANHKQCRSWGDTQKNGKEECEGKTMRMKVESTVEYALIYKLYVYNKNYSALTSLPRTQKTAAPAPANQNTGRERAPARLIWWGTVSSLPGWQENYIFNNIKKVREVPCNKFNLYSQVAKQTYSFDLHFRNIS